MSRGQQPSTSPEARDPASELFVGLHEVGGGFENSASSEKHLGRVTRQEHPTGNRGCARSRRLHDRTGGGLFDDSLDDADRSSRILFRHLSTIAGRQLWMAKRPGYRLAGATAQEALHHFTNQKAGDQESDASQNVFHAILR